jgi:hypothetical protein
MGSSTSSSALGASDELEELEALELLAAGATAEVVQGRDRRGPGHALVSSGSAIASAPASHRAKTPVTRIARPDPAHATRGS